MLIPLTESTPDPKRMLRVLSIAGLMFLGVGATAIVGQCLVDAGGPPVLATTLGMVVFSCGMTAVAITLRKGVLRPPTRALVVAADGVWLIDLATSARIAGGPPRDVRVECVTLRYSQSYSRSYMDADVAGVAGLVLGIPGAQAMTISPLNRRIQWDFHARDGLPPDLLVSDEGWLELVEGLGLRPRLRIR
jgi:hypothetical protein